MKQDELVEKLKDACIDATGALPMSVLCESIGALCGAEPVILPETATVGACVEALKAHKVGSVVLVDGNEKLSGIFTDRDCVMKVAGTGLDLGVTPIRDVMTANPVSESPDSTLAFALNLMSHGGFRHLPIVDDEHRPIGVLSVKDVIDHLVTRMLDKLLEIP